METENKKILLVEDDPNFGTILRDYLAMNDYNVTHAKNGMEGFEKFKKDKIDEYHGSIRRKFGNLNNARTGQVENSVDAQKGAKVESPLRAFDVDALARRDSVINSMTDQIGTSSDSINAKYVDESTKKRDEEYKKRNKEIQKAQATTSVEAQHIYNSINNVKNKKKHIPYVSPIETTTIQEVLDNLGPEVPLGGNGGDFQRSHNAVGVRGAVRIYNETVKENEDILNKRKKDLSSYTFEVTDDKFKLQKEKEKLGEVYDKTIEVTNHIHEGLLTEQIKQVQFATTNAWRSEETTSNVMEKTFEDTNILLQSKYAYELNMYINSIYEKNDIENKLNSEVWVKDESLDKISDNQELININKNQSSLSKNDKGEYKLHKGYHKVLTIDEITHTTAILEWTGKYPTVTYFIPDAMYLNMITKDGKEKTEAAMASLTGATIKTDKKDSEINDLDLLIYTYQILKKSILKDYKYIGDNQAYLYALHKVKLSIHSMLLSHHVKLKREEALFLDPFHFDLEQKPIGLKGTVGFISDDDLKYIEGNYDYHTTYRDISNYI